MHNETKVNTNNQESSPVDEKNVVPDATKYVGSYSIVYGRTYIEHGGAADHLAMRARQLSSLLMLIHGEGLAHFQRLSDNNQDGLLWLAHQLSTEIEDMVEIQARDVSRWKA